MATLEHRPKAVRTKLLGILNRRLFHRCMEILTRPLRRTKPHDVLDPEGYIRSVLYELAGYIADLEEQWLVGGLGGQSCLDCTHDTTHLGDPESGLPRTPADILGKIRKIKRDYRAAWGRSPSLEEFVNLAGEVHLNGVDKPFWKTLPDVNIFKILCPDLLHGFHKYFYDHIYRFNRTGMGQDEYDARVRSQIHFSGDRAFLHGVSHISQMTGMEHRLLERTHLPIVANAPGVINEKVTRATQGVMDCIYLAQLPVQSERSLRAYELAYETFMAYRQGWIENETRRGKKGVIPHFNIPKMHIIRHHPEHVRRKGSADNFSTETMEHLHVTVKDAYRASNHREWKEQTTRWMNRREIVRDFEAWRLWCQSKVQASQESQQGNTPHEVDELILRPEVDTDDGSDDSSLDAQAQNVGREEGEGEDEDKESVPGLEGEDKYEDPDTYGERLADAEDEEHEGERGKARFDRIRRWLKQQAGIDVGTSRKRKRRTDLDDPNQRSRTRPRLQNTTHGISDLQKVNKTPSIRRKPIQQVCQLYGLGLEELMRHIGWSAHLNNLPFPIDEYTEIDVWQALRARLPVAAYKSGTRMQCIRSKPAIRDRAAKFDPILYVNSEGRTARTAKLRGQVQLIFRLTPTTLVPNPPMMAYLHAFSIIPRSACKITGLLTVSKVDGQNKHRLVLASGIVRLCPSAPVIHGCAPRDVDRHNVLERFSRFYLNKYRSIDDYIFMCSDIL
ncbi:hypothetical protein FRC08_003497 [Ceratobasidium sp. 394]|nr:hypothetical protein FRC08_003497 [Ceratobasidium sp. 394]